MLADMDQEMKRRKLGAIIVAGDSTFGNPELYYVIGTGVPRGGIYLKVRSKDPITVVSNVDVGSVRKGRIRSIETYSEYEYEKALQRYGRNKAQIVLYDKVLKKHKVKGRIGFYGKVEVSSSLALVESLRRKGHKIVGEERPTLIDALRETKDKTEIDRIRNVGSRTEKVVEKTLEILRNTSVQGRQVLYQGDSLTVGNIKRFIKGFLAQEGLIDVEDTIFAAGTGSADPHYRGEETDPIREGEPIVFDIFPQEPGGYCFDTTRTYVVGKPSQEIKRMHETVLEAQLAALDNLREGANAKTVTELVCSIFEKKGYKTQRDVAKGDEKARTYGFIHSLGHGIGLTIGERPNLSVLVDENLKEGHVTSVEPGVYEPGLGGVRIEDIVVIRKNGVENLSTLDKTLEL
jgi:Xaa-Pro aminopeptidase